MEVFKRKIQYFRKNNLNGCGIMGNAIIVSFRPCFRSSARDKDTHGESTPAGSPTDRQNNNCHWCLTMEEFVIV